MRRDSRPCSCLFNAPAFQHIYQQFCARDSSGDTMFIPAVSAHQVALPSRRAFTPMPGGSIKMQTPTQRHPYLVVITVSKQKPFIIQYVDIPPQTVVNSGAIFGVDSPPKLASMKNC